MEARLSTARVAAGCQVYWPAPYEVCGVIKDKYNQMGGPNSFLLFPKSNELTNPGNTGKRSEFLGGNIYWSATTGAHPVAHDFLTKWGQLGYESGSLRYPTTDEIVLSDNTSRRQEFQGGSIYFSFATGAHAIYGLIRDRWISLGAETSYLGFPITDEQNTTRYTQLGARENQFQAGRIIANLANNTTQHLGWYGSAAPTPGARTANTLAITSEPLHAQEIPDPGEVPASEQACPSGTTDYSNISKSEWNCKWVESDRNEQEHFGRTGVSRGATVRNDSGDSIASAGFGEQHADADHNVSPRAVQLITRNQPYCIDLGYLERCEMGEHVVAMPSGEIQDTIYIVMQSGPDTENLGPASDTYDVGLITAHCTIGQPATGIKGYCDNEWMGPFRRIG